MQTIHRRGLLVAGVALAMLANVLQFRSIERDAPSIYAALSRYEDSDVGQLVNTGKRLRERYDLYLTLAEVAPGSTVLLPTANGRLPRETAARLYAIGRAAQVEPVAGGAASSFLHPEGEFDPRSFIVASGEGGDSGSPWAIAVATAGGQAREFLLLSWTNPEPERGDYELLLDTTLLTEDLRKGMER